MSEHMRFGSVLILTLVLCGCGAGDETPETGGTDPAPETIPGIEKQLVVTLHVKGGEVTDLEYLRKQTGDFTNSQAARKNTETWTVYVLLKPGVPEEFAVGQRNMLEAYVRPPLEFLMSSWSRNEKDWFGLLPQ